MKNLLIFFLLPMLVSCQTKPTEKDFEQTILQHYNEMSQSVGGGEYSNVNVFIEKFSTEQDSLYVVAATVKGTYQNGSIANDPGPRPFKNKVEFVIARRDKTWVVIQTREPQN